MTPALSPSLFQFHYIFICLSVYLHGYTVKQHAFGGQRIICGNQFFLFPSFGSWISNSLFFFLFCFFGCKHVPLPAEPSLVQDCHFLMNLSSVYRNRHDSPYFHNCPFSSSFTSVILSFPFNLLSS